MRLHILVEGSAEESFLNEWMPRFLPSHHTFTTIVHRGKGKLSEVAEVDPKRQGLLDQLPAKLRAYSKCLNSDTDRVLVLIDADDEPCKELKARLMRCHGRNAPNLTALFRIAIEETEAFFLGDRKAIKRAFPKAKLHKLDHYVQDSVVGTWELFREVIGYRPDFEDKPGWASLMGHEMSTDHETDANKSPSFKQFCRGILMLCGEATAKERPKKLRRKRSDGISK